MIILKLARFIGELPVPKPAAIRKETIWGTLFLLLLPKVITLTRKHIFSHIIEVFKRLKTQLNFFVGQFFMR